MSFSSFWCSVWNSVSWLDHIYLPNGLSIWLITKLCLQAIDLVCPIKWPVSVFDYISLSTKATEKTHIFKFRFRVLYEENLQAWELIPGEISVPLFGKRNCLLNVIYRYAATTLLGNYVQCKWEHNVLSCFTAAWIVHSQLQTTSGKALNELTFKRWHLTVFFFILFKFSFKCFPAEPRPHSLCLAWVA